MRLRYVGLCFFILLVSAVFARADGLPVDPYMDVSDPACPSPMGAGCPANVGANQGFTFTVNAQGGGVFMGTNESGTENTWSTLLFTFVTPTTLGPITCTSSGVGGGPAPFLSPCTVETDPSNENLTDLFYTNHCIEGTCPPGIIPNDIFTINLNDQSGGTFLSTGSWPAGLTFLAYPNTMAGQEMTPSGGPPPFVTLSSMPEPGTLTLVGVGIVALLGKNRFGNRRQPQN